MKSLSVAVIGLRFGSSHLKGVIENGASVRYICDINPDLLKTVGDENGIPEEKRTVNWLDVVNCPEVNTVILATPDMTHREQVVALLDAGKHVLCEKPLALVKEDLDAIVAATKRNPTSKFMVGQICRFTPAFVKAKELIDAGRVGELYFVESEYAHDYAKMYRDNPKHWRLDPKRHGVVGGGCHAVDLLRWLVGEDPYEVHAYGTHKMLPMLTYDDSTISIMKFPGNVMGKVFVSTGCKRGYTMRTCVYGTKGTLIFDNKNPTMTFFEVNTEGVTEEHTIEIDINNHNAADEFRAFADCIINDTPVAMSVYEGAKTVAACLAIVESSEKGGEVINPNYDFA